jgi:hypothetical protein
MYTCCVIQTATAVDGASVCAKFVSMVHDLPQDITDLAIICQTVRHKSRSDFANAF